MFQEAREGIFQGLEDALSQLIGWVAEELTNQLQSKLFSKKEVSRKFDLKNLELKEKWFHPNAFGYSLISRKDIGISKIDFSRNTVVCGTTGAGKNVTLDNIIEDRLKQGLPVTFIDGKGDNEALRKFKALNEHYGRKCYIFSERYPLSDNCNPILEGEASTIVDRLFSIFEWGEPYYADTNYIALERAVRALKKSNSPITIQAIHDYIDSNLKTKETQNIINKLSKINNSAFGKLLSGKEDAITFSKIRDEKASIYIGLSTLGYPEVSSAIGKLFIYELMYHSYSIFADRIDPEVKPKAPFSVVIDELGSLITEDFISLVNKCRGAGIGVCVSFQLLSDLDSVSPQFRDRLIGNMNNFFIGHCHLESEAEFWSKMIGTAHNQKFTYQTQNELEQAMGSVRDVEEFLIHPNTFKNLKIGQFVVKSFFPHDYLDVIKVHFKTDDEFMKRIERRNLIRRKKEQSI